MSKTIVEILRNLHELNNENPESEGFQIRMDITRALRNVDFDPEEAAILSALFLIEPTPPERDRPNKNGGYSGRPKGGTTQSLIASLINAKSPNAANIHVSRKLKSACAKIADYLGADYQDQSQPLPS